MGQRTKQTLLQGRHTNGYQTHEKMLNNTHYQKDKEHYSILTHIYGI